MWTAVRLTLFSLTMFGNEAQHSLEPWFARQPQIQTWSADVIQTRILKTLTQPLTARGRVWFEAPNRFRWELGSPPQTIAVRQPEGLLVIYPRLRRAERYVLSDTKTTPWKDALLSLETGFPRSRSDLEARFRILSQETTASTLIMRLQPRSQSARRLIQEVSILLEDVTFELKATEIRFADGSSMRNDFSNSVVNGALDAALFKPVLGEEFTVIEPSASGKP